MKKFLSVLSLLLSITIFFVAFTSCDSSSAEPKETSASDKAEESINEGTEAKPDGSEAVGGETSAASETETEATTEAEPPRPVANYDADFFLLIHHDSNRMEYHWVEESSNDVLSQAIYDRQQKVYDHLGVSVVGTKALATYNYIEPFKNAVKNKDGSIDMLLTHVYHGIDGFVTGNYLAKFDEIPGVNLDAEYWNKDIMDEASFNGEYYLAKNDFNILYTHCITFNKDIMEKYSDAIEENVYTLVEDYRWVLDRIISLAQLVHVDATSDGKTIDDTFGIAGACNIEVVGFMQASDVSIIEQNEKGEYVLSAYNEKNKVKTTALVDKFKALIDSDCAWIWKYGSGQNIKFEDGKTLMMLIGTNHLPNLLNFDINFGVLPYPMYDENQKDVGYRSLQWGGYTCVPSYVGNIDMVGDTLEMLAFFSDGVNEAFYEKLIGKQVAESPVDKKMLEIIWDGICTDFAQTYFSAISNTQILYMLPDLTQPERTASLSSYIASAEKSVNKLLKKLTLTN